MAIKPNVARMRDVFLKSKLVDEMQMKAAMAQVEQWGGRLPKALVELGFLDEDTVTDILAKALRVPVAHLGMVQKDAAAMSRLDPEYCEMNAIFPMQLRERVLMLAMADPSEIDVADAVAARMGARLQVYLSSERQILTAINKHYRGQTTEQFETRPNLARKAVTSEFRPMEQQFTLDDSAPPSPSSPSSANSILDDMMDSRAPVVAGLTPDELSRLQVAKSTQEKTQAILGALQELLSAKGIMNKPK
jgi:Type II secretion system (T2SS), protein E, N-terminal domain